MALNKAKRQAIEKMVYETFDILDKSGKNTEYYKTLFKPMSDTQFDNWLKKMFSDDDNNFFLEVEPYENETTIEDAYEAADYLGVPVFEHVVMPFANPDGEPVATQEPVPVIYVPVKRLQQMNFKKNTMSTNIDKRNPKTGQVTNDDKNARSSDVENISLVALGGDAMLKELLVARADDMNAKSEMSKRIKNDGYVSIKDIPSNKSDKVALNTLDTYFLAAGLKTNLVTEGLLLKRTLKNMNRDVSSISSKYEK